MVSTLRNVLPWGYEFSQGIKFCGFRGSYFISEIYSWVTFAHVTWKSTSVCICKISCMSNGDNNNLDCILKRPASDKLVVMTESSPQQPRCPKNPNNAGSMVELPPCKGMTGKLREEALARVLVYLLLMRYLGQTYALLITWKTLASSTPTKIYTHEY